MDVGTEYDDGFNYDDGTEKQKDNVPVVDDYDYDNDIDIEEETGPIAMTSTNFKLNQDKYDLEIISDQESEDTSKKVEPVKILTLQQHMQNLIESMTNLEIEKQQVEQDIARVKQQQEEVITRKQKLFQKLGTW
ncbi:uncharacterized protein SPAPADRAFT_63322 [Spathaspora passalidarum NRRL Y-27907]|uniref:Uncharacterized protein n=1 Tax=Spathaspora passalidarum (strain NRRL Y-27907 / 11-Y1) TaxID=619300 RepID=G3AUC6_SPAPN|nr:uncharacterized protein SPAPADRAFT_63322 [Spathaspora passalidarum NRRL Y-27907]EGW30502.1 hypothetical protein SPAPADRAFT_63322 [Spathaspora passalidarum NRRL Y-27907]